MTSIEVPHDFTKVWEDLFDNSGRYYQRTTNSPEIRTNLWYALQEYARKNNLTYREGVIDVTSQGENDFVRVKFTLPEQTSLPFNVEMQIQTNNSLTTLRIGATRFVAGFDQSVSQATNADMIHVVPLYQRIRNEIICTNLRLNAYQYHELEKFVEQVHFGITTTRESEFGKSFERYVKPSTL